MAYEQRYYQDYEESESRSSDAWLSSLLAQPNSNSGRENSGSDNSRSEIKNGLSSIRKMLEAQQRQSEELETPLLSSLTAMQSQMAQLVSALNKPQASATTAPNNRRQRLNADSLLADIETRQVEISEGYKKPNMVQRGADRRADASAAQSQALMRQDLSALGHAIADVVPQKTIDALRHELRQFNAQQPQDLTSIHENLASLANHVERLSQKPQPEFFNASDNNALLDRKFENFSRSLRDSLQQPSAPTQDLTSIHESLAMLASHVERLSQKPQHESVDNNALLDRKFEQLARNLRDNLQQPAAPTQDLERIFSVLLQRFEATDRKIEQLAQKEAVKPAPLEKRQPDSETPQFQLQVDPALKAAFIERRMPVNETPQFNVQVAPKAIDRLQERMKETPAPTPMPIAAVKPVPRATTRPVDTGNTAFDMPLEPGSGSPRNPKGLPQSMNFSPGMSKNDMPKNDMPKNDMPMARISFEMKDETLLQNNEAKTSSLQGLLAHKNKILLGLALLLLAFGSVKVLDMLKPAPKKAASVQEMPIAPSRKIEVAKIPQTPATQEATLFAPNKDIDPIITGSNSASPRVVPGVAMNNGWSPIVSPQEKNSLQSLADSGNPSAQFELATRMFEGKLLPKNEAGAITLYQKSADQNFAPAQFRLGSLYEKGTGVTKDRAQASKLYLAAASLGHAKAMHNLAVLSADNSEGKSDLKVASQWFRKAAEHGVTDSQYNLAVLYARGFGVELSMTESYKWFALAALGGDADAGNKRDDIAKRLSPEVLSATKIAVDNFQPRKEPASATRVDLPAELSNNAQSSLLTRQISGKKI